MPVRIKHGHAQTATQGKPSSTYYSWQTMIRRCTDEKFDSYKYYGGRGIKVEDNAWLDFNNFLLDMGDRPNGTSLDRIDVNKGYYKDNCKWSSSTEQANNRRNTLYFSLNGATKPLMDWCKEYGTDHRLVRSRITNGMGLLEALTRPVRKYKNEN
jgi:hypothetical protein